MNEFSLKLSSVITHVRKSTSLAHKWLFSSGQNTAATQQPTVNNVVKDSADMLHSSPHGKVDVVFAKEYMIRQAYDSSSSSTEGDVQHR